MLKTTGIDGYNLLIRQPPVPIDTDSRQRPALKNSTHRVREPTSHRERNGLENGNFSP